MKRLNLRRVLRMHTLSINVGYSSLICASNCLHDRERKPTRFTLKISGRLVARIYLTVNATNGQHFQLLESVWNWYKSVHSSFQWDINNNAETNIPCKKEPTQFFTINQGLATELTQTLNKINTTITRRKKTNSVLNYQFINLSLIPRTVKLLYEIIFKIFNNIKNMICFLISSFVLDLRNSY
ncbi:hypothetical protein AGLY_015910 [Aphis glycines]|uniref:Uncharacterized protein n=1 Tax=Aphis glycines TaxID=307491 RepID=A0A6G0SZK8_APHGL|nr:hypothetical protein AGLY_015910 [Aphis glycines]